MVPLFVTLFSSRSCDIRPIMPPVLRQPNTLTLLVTNDSTALPTECFISSVASPGTVVGASMLAIMPEAVCLHGQSMVPRLPFATQLIIVIPSHVVPTNAAPPKLPGFSGTLNPRTLIVRFLMVAPMQVRKKPKCSLVPSNTSPSV